MSIKCKHDRFVVTRDEALSWRGSLVEEPVASTDDMPDELLTELQGELRRFTTKRGVSPENTYACTELQRLARMAAGMDTFPSSEHHWLVKQFIIAVAEHDSSQDVQASRDLFRLSPEKDEELLKVAKKKEPSVLQNVGVCEAIAGRHYGVGARRMRDLKPKALEGCAISIWKFVTESSEAKGAAREAWANLVRGKLQPEGTLAAGINSQHHEPDQPTSIGRVLAQSSQLRATLRAHNVQSSIKRDIVDEIVRRLGNMSTPSITAVRGDAGAGKTVIAGQTYDVLRENASVIVVPCQIPLGVQTTADELDITIGEQLLHSPDGLVAAARECAQASTRPVVLIFDTIDTVLDERTSQGIIGLFRRIVNLGASIIFTCRHYDYSIWFRPTQGQSGPFAPATITPVDVLSLSKTETEEIVSSYFAFHTSNSSETAFQFAESIWSISKDRKPLQRIVTNPLLLVMLCETFADADSIPPDLTTKRLCDAYYKEKIARSRRYGPSHQISVAKNSLWLDIAGELWRRSKKQIVLAVPESWFDKTVLSRQALDDLLSEDVLVRHGVDSTAIQFNHQFLAEYSMAIYLRDKAPAELNSVLHELTDNPNSRWFAWQIVRHAIATALSEDDVEELLGQINLNEPFAFQAAARGLAERSEDNYLYKLVKYEVHYYALLDVLDLVSDNRIDTVLDMLATVIRRGTDENASRATVIAGRLALRSSNEALRSPAKLTAVLDAIMDLRAGKTKAKGKDRSFPDQLLGNLFSYSIERQTPLPDDVLLHAHGLLAGATPTAFHVLIRAHLIDGVGATNRKKLLNELLSSRHANKVVDLGVQLINATANWSIDREHDDEGSPADCIDLRPDTFLASGRPSSMQLRAAAVASAAQVHEELRPSVVQMFIDPPSSKVAKRALICLQEILKAGGKDWLFAQLRAQATYSTAPVGPLCGLLKSHGLTSETPEVRHVWADWFKPFVTENLYGTVDAYLQLGWDDPDHFEFAVTKLKRLPPERRNSVVANFAYKLSSEKAGALSEILNRVEFEDNPVLRVRLMDTTGNKMPAGLLDMITSVSTDAAAQAMIKLETAARNKRPWLTPDLLHSCATHRVEHVRTGVLKVLAILVKNRTGDVDKAVETWINAAIKRGSGAQPDAVEELTQLIRICHSYLRDSYGSAPDALAAVTGLVDQLIESLDVQIAIRRELLALIKTAASRQDTDTRKLASRWILRTLDKVDVSPVQEGHAFAKETLGKLVEWGPENGGFTFNDIISRIKAWKSGTLKVVVDLIVTHHPDQENSPLLDEVLEADEGEAVRSDIASYRLKDQN